MSENTNLRSLKRRTPNSGSTNQENSISNDKVFTEESSLQIGNHYNGRVGGGLGVGKMKEEIKFVSLYELTEERIGFRGARGMGIMSSAERMKSSSGSESEFELKTRELVKDQDMRKKSIGGG